MQDWCVHSHFRSMSTFGDFFFAFLATLHGQPHTNVNRELEYVYRAQGLSRARAFLQERCWKRATAFCTKWKMLRIGRTPFAVSDSPELENPWSLRSMGGTEGAGSATFGASRATSTRSHGPSTSCGGVTRAGRTACHKSETPGLQKPIETIVFSCRLLKASRDLQVLRSSPTPS